MKNVSLLLFFFLSLSNFADSQSNTLKNNSIKKLSTIKKTEPTNLKEYQVKAALLSNFLKYVQWPDSYSIELGGSLIVGIIGEDPFGDFLDKSLSGRSVDGRGITIKRFLGVKDLTPVHVLVVNYNDIARRAQVLAATKGKPVLTIGNGSSFVDSEGIIAFVLQDETQKVRFQLNLRSAREKKLQIYPRLTKWADRVIK